MDLHAFEWLFQFGQQPEEACYIKGQLRVVSVSSLTQTVAVLPCDTAMLSQRQPVSMSVKAESCA
ncbi:hypothetical protein AWB78_01135 [Caballeronia calidae]|uniref:Uncharacterized protein n=1 Tax=Caballeronia calidae TaxID=1777139 RepID=A0A158A1J0_9BURK|nr:hypothetical protein AWB78_01135 [Caballeronia calidae]